MIRDNFQIKQMRGMFTAKNPQTYLKMERKIKNKSRGLLIVFLALDIRVMTLNQLLKREMSVKCPDLCLGITE